MDQNLASDSQNIASEEKLANGPMESSLVVKKTAPDWNYLLVITSLLIIPLLVTGTWLLIQRTASSNTKEHPEIISAWEFSNARDDLASSASAQLQIEEPEKLAKPTASPTGTPNPTDTPTPSPTPAQTSNPASAPANNKLGFANNKYGVHLFSGPDQIELAAELVNSNGGDWGWATMTWHINNRDTSWWNEVFAKCKEKHIIPIIQLMNDGNIPTDDQLAQAADFLASLGWPTKIRVISAFNEVNADEYWGGTIDPEGYARSLNFLIDQLKTKSSEFFVLNGPFNASAASGPNYPRICVHTDLGVDTCYLSEDQFLERMNQAVPGIFSKLDGWASHCYPHPGYRGHPLDSRVSGEKDWEAGRNTMGSYKWELKILAKYGAGGLPVFITETGWPHAEGAITVNNWFNQQTVAEYYRIAFTQVWGPDNRVAAATPFILKYDQYDNFAFIKADGSKFSQWETVKNLPKIAGNPPTN